MATTAERFWSRVDKSGDCWIWQGTFQPRGYGMFYIRGRMHLSHRVAYELAFGPLPKWTDQTTSVCVLHRCDVRACVNPSHLFLGTNADNVADMIRKGRDRRVPCPGEKNGNAVLTAKEVAQIRSSSESHSELARKFPVSRPTITKIKTGLRWAHL